MALKEHLKDIKTRNEIKLVDWFLYLGIIFILSIAVFILLGFKLESIFFWNIIDVLDLVDYYLNAFFHRLFDSLGAIIHFITHYKHYDLKNALYFIWHNEAINFMPNRILSNIDSIEQLNRISRAYFIWFGVFILLWVYLFSYMFSLLDKFLPSKILNILYKPLNIMFFDINMDESYLKKLGADKGNFFKNFNNKFFKQKMIVEDGYKRNKYLKFLKTIPAVLSGDGKYYKSFYHIKQCFVNDQEFLDLFLIIEGYIAPNHKPYLFDKYIGKLSREEYKNYKSFNLKDEVTLSLDAIKYFLNDETEKYEKLLKKRMIVGRSVMAIYLNKQKKLLQKDASRVTRMLFGINNEQLALRYNVDEVNELKDKMFEAIRNNDLETWWELFKERMLDVFIGFFRFVLLREIFRRYMNIPSGTMVVKIDDYTLRNIIDNYDMNSFIAIHKNKNDGQSKSFENDILTNIFFLTYWMYNYKYQEESIQEKIDKIWNNLVDISDDDELDKMKDELIKGLKESIQYIRALEKEKEGEKNGN